MTCQRVVFMLKVIMQAKARYILNKNPKIKTP